MKFGLLLTISGVSLWLSTPMVVAEEPLTPYALDDFSREVPARGRVKCPKVAMLRYEGDHLRYHRKPYIAAAFAPHLARFEAVVKAVAIEIYGRAPRRIRHLGTYNCRRIGGYPELISEHGLGNAIDVAGFDFGPLPVVERASALARKLPKRLHRSFKVRMLDHWDASGKTGRVHKRFLHTLARRLVAAKDIFRVLLGPAYPGHKNHFHFDMAPYRMVSIW